MTSFFEFALMLVIPGALLIHAGLGGQAAPSCPNAQSITRK
jgi:hypothetical protein